jgi:hypothetical protein
VLFLVGERSGAAVSGRGGVDVDSIIILSSNISELLSGILFSGFDI